MSTKVKTKVVAFKPTDTVHSDSRYVIFDPKTNLFYGAGVGWRSDVTRVDGYTNRDGLIQRLISSHGEEYALKMLTLHKVIQVDIAHTYHDDIEVPAKQIERLKLGTRISHAIKDSKLSETAARYYRDYHMRGPEKSKYHNLFEFDPSRVRNWFSKLPKDRRTELAASQWYEPDYYDSREFLSRLNRAIGLKYPDIQYGTNFFVTKTKAQAVQFRLTYNIPFKFVDLNEVYDKFEATGKITV